ncbi:hypothetical protein BH20VER3_BH20VER3_03520 [soil metagenome]
MTTTFTNPALTPETSFGLAEMKSLLIEPFLILGSACFWIIALPFVAFSLMCVKVWDTILALKPGQNARQNPLILRRGLAKGGVAVRGAGATRTAQI